MAIERTLSIIKPEAVARGLIGEILQKFEKAGLKIIAAKLFWLNMEKAEGFYAVHKERPFFASLTQYMSSGPVLVSVLEGEGAISKTARSWAPRIRPRRPRGPFAANGGWMWREMPSMARMRRKRQLRKYPFSLNLTRFIDQLNDLHPLLPRP